MKRKAITTSRKRAERMLEQQRTSIERAAEQRGRRAATQEVELRLRDELTRIIRSMDDEVVLGSVPEHETCILALSTERHPFGRRPLNTRPYDERYLGVESRFRTKKQYWRCDETGQLVVWWTWEPAGARAFRRGW